MTVLESPGVVLMDNPDRRCADKPTWWWFAFPFQTSDAPPTLWTDPTLKSPDARGRLKEGHARAVVACTHCPLALACLQASWKTEEHGTYGGVNETERWVLGGKGRHGGNQSRNAERREEVLAKITERFGSPLHPVVRWLAARPTPRAITRRPDTSEECPQGHPWTEETTGYRDGYRRCKECDRERSARNRAAAREERVEEPAA